MVIDFRCKHHGHMLELVGEGEMDVTLIDRLNELLEAERAGVDTLSRLRPEAGSPEMQKLFEEVRDDEAWSCAGLVRSIKTMGGTISEKKGDFAEKVMREPTLAARLRFLNPGPSTRTRSRIPLEPRSPVRLRPLEGFRRSPQRGYELRGDSP